MKLFFEQNASHTCWAGNEQDMHNLRIDSLLFDICAGSEYPVDAGMLCRFFTADPSDLAARHRVMADLRKDPQLLEAFKALLHGMLLIKKAFEKGKHILVDLRMMLWEYRTMRLFTSVTDDFFAALAAKALCPELTELIAQFKSLKSESRCEDILKTVGALDTAWMNVRGMRIGVNILAHPDVVTTAVVFAEHRDAPYSPYSIFDKEGLDAGDAGLSREKKFSFGKYDTFFERAILRDFKIRYKKQIGDFEKALESPHDVEAIWKFALCADSVAFLLAGIEFERRLADRGFWHSTPRFADHFAAKRLYSAALALGSPDPVVDNDLELDKKFYVLTGANHSGKTELLLCISQAQFLGQLGWNVPAAEISFSAVPAIFTLFSAGEDKNTELSRMELEAKRFAEIMGQMKPGAFVLLNEPMTSTNPDEGAEICRDMIDKLTAAGGSGIMVTHLYELFSLLDGDYGSLYMQSIPQPDGGALHTFKVIAAAPECESYAVELAHSAGIRYPDGEFIRAFGAKLGEKA